MPHEQEASSSGRRRVVHRTDLNAEIKAGRQVSQEPTDEDALAALREASELGDTSIQSDGSPPRFRHDDDFGYFLVTRDGASSSRKLVFSFSLGT